MDEEMPAGVRLLVADCTSPTERFQLCCFSPAAALGVVAPLRGLNLDAGVLPPQPLDLARLLPVQPIGGGGATTTAVVATSAATAVDDDEAAWRALRQATIDELLADGDGRLAVLGRWRDDVDAERWLAAVARWLAGDGRPRLAAFFLLHERLVERGLVEPARLLAQYAAANCLASLAGEAGQLAPHEHTPSPLLRLAHIIAGHTPAADMSPAQLRIFVESLDCPDAFKRSLVHCLMLGRANNDDDDDEDKNKTTILIDLT